MDISELINEKTKLQDKIQNLVNEFQDKFIVNISVDFVDSGINTVGNNIELKICSVKVEL